MKNKSRFQRLLERPRQSITRQSQKCGALAGGHYPVRTLIVVVWLGATLVAISGCLSHRTKAEANDYLDDKVTAARVLQVLHSQSDYAYPHVQVDVTNGIVSLGGSVTTPLQRAKAAELAKSVNGVHDIHNNITVQRSGQFRRKPSEVSPVGYLYG